jgi:hypothetical protein
MGFRDLPLFNQALLGKQGWRLMVRHDSLYAKVLKGKYYPHGDFISATKKKKSSKTWRAILWGREALKKGLIKRIGPGDSVNIWTDQWIGALRSMKPLVRLEEVRMEQVHELFLPGTRTWNEQLIRSSFIPHDAEEILKVRPGSRLQEDSYAWADERSGWYSVRSCYRRLKEEQDQKEVMTDNTAASSGNSQWSTALWRLHVPPKVRNFWWRALNSSLPSKTELKRRHIEKEDHCVACGVPGESRFHVALKCTFAQQFWRTVQQLTGFRLPNLHEATWTRDVLSADLCTPSESALIVSGAWSL